jgi:hypothetical protein
VCKCRSKKDNKIYAVKVIEVEGEDDSAIRREIDIFSSLCDSDLVVRYGGCYRKGNNLLVRPPPPLPTPSSPSSRVIIITRHISAHPLRTRASQSHGAQPQPIE